MNAFIHLLLFIAPSLALYEAGYPFEPPYLNEPPVQVQDPSKTTHAITRTAELFPNHAGHIASMFSAWKRIKISNMKPVTPNDGNDINSLNPAGHPSTFNNYQSTPTPGIHFCDRTNFRGNCVYVQVVATPKICAQVPDGAWKNGGSFMIEKDLQCAFHSTTDCSSYKRTPGIFFWPQVISLRPGQQGLSNGPIVAYKCRQCLGCNTQNHPTWDGNSTQELAPANGSGWLLGQDENGRLTWYSPGKGAPGRPLDIHYSYVMGQWDSPKTDSKYLTKRHELTVTTIPEVTSVPEVTGMEVAV